MEINYQSLTQKEKDRILIKQKVAEFLQKGGKISQAQSQQGGQRAIKFPAWKDYAQNAGY